jgi:hypothetical protein
MNQEEREALTGKATARIVAGLQQTTNAEEMLRSILTGYGVELFAAGGRNTEEWIGRLLASLPIPILITRTLPEGSGEHEPVVAYHWKTQDLEGDAVTFAHGLEQALLSVMHQQEQQP